MQARDIERHRETIKNLAARKMRTRPEDCIYLTAKETVEVLGILSDALEYIVQIQKGLNQRDGLGYRI